MNKQTVTRFVIKKNDEYLCYGASYSVYFGPLYEAALFEDKPTWLNLPGRRITMVSVTVEEMPWEPNQ